MNDEIKEMLELHIKNDIDLLPKNQKTVLDYITNLQQENNNLKTSLDESQEVVIDLQQKNVRLRKQLEYLRTDEYLNQVKWERNFNETMNKKLKSRIEKAVEYIEKLREINYKTIDILIEEATTLKEILNGENVRLNNILNILNGKE